MLRVALLTHTGGVGGSEQILVDVLREADPERYELVLIGNPNPGLSRWLCRRTGAPVARQTVRLRDYESSGVVKLRRRLGASADRVVPVPARELERPSEAPARRSKFEGPVVALQGVWNQSALTHLLRRVRPDVLHINNGGFPGSRGAHLAALAARAARVPRVVHFIHSTPESPIWPAAADLAVDRLLDRNTDLWCTFAEAPATILRARRAVSPDKVRVVYAGVQDRVAVAPARDLGFRPGSLNIAVVGALVPCKGHGTLLAACALLRERGVDFQVAIVGDGELRSLIEDRIDTLGLSAEVQLAGYRHDVGAIYEAADVGVIASTFSECFPLVVLEAMVHGLPVVGSRLAGIPEQIVDGETGLLVEPGDALLLAGALQSLAEDPRLRVAMGHAARRRVIERFGVARFVREVESVWTG